jgi:hypothetical protein
MPSQMMIRPARVRRADRRAAAVDDRHPAVVDPDHPLLREARRVHPAFSTGTRSEWWGGEAGFYAYARTTGDDEVLVLLNRDPSDRTVTNGLAFAHLTATRWEDVLTGDTFDAAGDSLTVNVPARGSRVLVPR